MTGLTPAQRNMLRVLAVYDRRGTEDPIYFDTRDGRTVRTLRALAARGLADVWPDLDDDRRWWAALPALPVEGSTGR